MNNTIEENSQKKYVTILSTNSIGGSTIVNSFGKDINFGNYDSNNYQN